MTDTFPNVRTLSTTAKQILNKRYMWKDEKTWDELVNRVTNYVIPANHPDFELMQEMIMHRYFLPNSPCLANAGKESAGLAACFVLDFQDTIEEIFQTKYDFALVARKGGGGGTTLSNIRPKGDSVRGSTHGYAAGPVAFASTISADMSVITQGGLRGMALMFTISCYHPDILEFIDAKEVEGNISNANMSVVVDDAFMNAVRNDENYWTEFNGKKYKEYKARDVFNKIVEGAWRNGEPALLFQDRIDDSPYKYTGQKIQAVNPCAEEPLPPNGVCNLGSLDLSKFVKKDKSLDLEKLKLAVQLGTRFLDMVIDKNSYPTKAIEDWAKRNRPIGVGIFGFADYCLIKEIAYGSDKSLEELEFIISNIYNWSKEESEKLGKELGIPEECMKLPEPRRNITLTTVAPTGTVSLIGGASSGIEPIFSELVIRNDKTGTYVFESDLASKPYFKCAVSTNGAEREVTWEEHVKILASAQKHIDAGVSKCIEKGTLIPTDKGLIKIEDFSDVKKDDSFSNTNERFFTEDGYKIDSHYKAGKKLATKITMNNGASITGASLSHKILTDKGWKVISELNVGDIVLGKRIESHGQGKELVEWNDIYNTNSNKIATPKCMSEEFAKFLGMITADGHTNTETGYVGISCKDKDTEEAFIDLCKSLFEIYPNITIDKRNGVKSIYITSRNLSLLIEGLIGKGAYNKKVPSQILRGNAEEKLAYLSGITLDGYIARDGLTVYFGMSEKLAKDIAEICRSFGYVQTYIGEKKVKGYGTAFGVTVGGFLQKQIECVEKRKNSVPKEKDYLVYVSRETIESTRVSMSHPKYYALKSMRLFRKSQSYCWKSTAEALGWNTNILAYKITNIENVGLKEMYDIEVSESHEYTICGVTSHNTINFPSHTHKETIAKAFVMAWEMGCKGIAVYRNQSRKEEVLSAKNIKKDLCPKCGKETEKIDNKVKCTNPDCNFNMSVID